MAHAAAVADETGLERLTLAAVAGRAGVRLPSLYKHVAGLDALHSHLAAAACAELAAELAAALPGGPGGDGTDSSRDTLLRTALAYRSWALRRPGAYAATLRAPEGSDPEHTAAAGRLLDVVLTALSGYGLDDDDAVDAVRGLRALLHGFVSLELAGGFALPQDTGATFRRLVDSYADTLASWGTTPGRDRTR
ncbi:TetR/AcrR family transcriptional regulator [Kineococcus sp. NUM-3379]